MVNDWSTAASHLLANKHHVTQLHGCITLIHRKSFRVVYSEVLLYTTWPSK